MISLLIGIVYRTSMISETHFHSDVVSGHLDLANKTGATIVFGRTATAGYSAHIAKDNEDLQLGSINIRVLHTPGHSMESVCYERLKQWRSC